MLSAESGMQSGHSTGHALKLHCKLQGFAQRCLRQQTFGQITQLRQCFPAAGPQRQPPSVAGLQHSKHFPRLLIADTCRAVSGVRR